MLTENEVLELINSLKNKIINLKTKNSELKKYFKKAKEFGDSVTAQLQSKEQELKNQLDKQVLLQQEIDSLKEQLESKKQTTQSLQQTIQRHQETDEADKAAKEAFMQELSRVIEDANKALEN